MVVDDTLRHYKDKEGNQKTNRILNCVDLDQDERLAAMFGVTIEMDDIRAGKASESSLRGVCLTLSIQTIRQFEWNKGLGFSGRVVSIDSRMVEQPIQPPK